MRRPMKTVLITIGIILLVLFSLVVGAIIALWWAFKDFKIPF